MQGILKLMKILSLFWSDELEIQALAMLSLSICAIIHCFKYFDEIFASPMWLCFSILQFIIFFPPFFSHWAEVSVWGMFLWYLEVIFVWNPNNICMKYVKYLVKMVRLLCSTGWGGSIPDRPLLVGGAPAPASMMKMLRVMRMRMRMKRKRRWMLLSMMRPLNSNASGPLLCTRRAFGWCLISFKMYTMKDMHNLF